ncbi:MAG: hypothetical protein HOP03_08905 [Lysobacter sp.]|nr:hypothetical protein [Lysobacter sp.]
MRALLVAAALWPALAMAQEEPWVPLERAPEEIERLLLGLKTADSGLPLTVRQGMLRRVEAIEVPRAEGPSDHYLRMKHEGDGVYFNAIVRTFAAARPEDTVYLLQVASEIDTCAGLKALLGADDRVGRKFCAYDEEQGAARIHPDADERFGFIAYRLDGRGRAHVVTRRVLPEDPMLNLPKGEAYGVHDETGSDPGVWVDLSRLSEVPVLRLYVELGDSGGLPRDHPRAFPGGYPGRVYTVHFGFLVWNGQRFDLRNSVPRALWPCTYDDSAPSGQSCLERDPDPFVSPADLPARPSATSTP